ncbi:MAG: hypothetical protein R2882_06195 [Gemmatimonadales bacterium]
MTGIVYDDPRSPFNGVRRVFDINSLDVDNPDGPTVWYTDPFGNNAKTSPFPGSIPSSTCRRIDSTASGSPGRGSSRTATTAGPACAPN